MNLVSSKSSVIINKPLDTNANIEFIDPNNPPQYIKDYLECQKTNPTRIDSATILTDNTLVCPPLSNELKCQGKDLGYDNFIYTKKEIWECGLEYYRESGIHEWNIGVCDNFTYGLEDNIIYKDIFKKIKLIYKNNFNTDIDYKCIVVSSEKLNGADLDGISRIIVNYQLNNKVFIYQPN